MERIREKYGSLDEPRFHFVSTAIDEEPYGDLGRHLRSCATGFSEDTDDNYDVSFGCILKKGREVVVVRISMVGPYAILVRCTDAPCVLIHRSSSPKAEFEAEVLGCLASEPLTLLGRELLAEPIELKGLVNVEPDQVTHYQALFTDGTAPWEARR